MSLLDQQYTVNPSAYFAHLTENYNYEPKKEPSPVSSTSGTIALESDPALISAHFHAVAKFNRFHWKGAREREKGCSSSVFSQIRAVDERTL